MIPKQMYIDLVNSLISLNKFEEKAYSLGINIYDVDSIEGVKHGLERLLSYCTDDNDDGVSGTNLEYFLYDLEAGNSPVAENCITTEGGKWSLRNPEELFEYLKSQSYNIEDKDYKTEDKKSYTEDDLMEIFKGFAK